MSLTNAPPAVTAIRDMLLACSSVTGAGITTDKIWYPSAVAESDDATAVDAMPRIVLGEEDWTRNRYAEGARGLAAGSLVINIQAELGTGALETLARSICDDLELLSHSQGLANLRCRTGLSSDPDQAMVAADASTGDTSSAFASIVITAEYGLTA